MTILLTNMLAAPARAAVINSGRSMRALPTAVHNVTMGRGISCLSAPFRCDSAT